MFKLKYRILLFTMKFMGYFNWTFKNAFLFFKIQNSYFFVKYFFYFKNFIKIEEKNPTSNCSPQKALSEKPLRKI